MKPTVIIGNPPFLGGNRIRTERGDNYINFLRKNFSHFSLKADYACFWILKTIEVKPLRSGFVMPKNIASNNSREMGIEKILDNKGKIFFSLPDIKWGGSASVYVKIFCFGWDPLLKEKFDAHLNEIKSKSKFDFQIPNINDQQILQNEIEKTMIKIENYRKFVCQKKQIGLTNLYNEMLIQKKHHFLRNLHQKLDELVAKIYGFPLEDLDNEEKIIDFLTQLNHEYSKKENLKLK